MVNKAKNRQLRACAPVLFGTKNEVGEKDGDRCSGQTDDARGQRQKPKGVIRPRSEQARKNKIQFHERCAEWENPTQQRGSLSSQSASM